MVAIAVRFILSRLDFHSPLGKRPPISPMASLALPSAPSSRRLPWLVALALALLAAGAVLVAQVSGDRGIAPIASSTDIEVRGIKVDVSGKNSEDARLEGWRVAQREAWKKLGGPAIPDSQIEVFEGRGHTIYQDEPERCVARVLDFIAMVDART